MPENTLYTWILQRYVRAPVHLQAISTAIKDDELAKERPGEEQIHYTTSLKRLDNKMRTCYKYRDWQEYPAIDTMNASIRRLRELRALSQRELAAQAKLSVTTVNRIETGQRKPMPRTVRKLAHALGVAPEELLTEQPRLLE